MENIGCQINEIMEAIKQIKSKQNDYEKEFLNHPEQTKNKKQEISLKDLSTKIQAVENMAKEINTTLKDHEERLDELEQYSCSNCLLLHGCDLPISKEDNYNNFISKLLSKLNYKLGPNFITPQDIDIAHYLPPGKKGKPIIVKFLQRSIRNAVFFNKSKFKDCGMSITECLTKKRLLLLKESQKKFGFKNVWTSSGKIFTIINGSKFNIKSIHDILNI